MLTKLKITPRSPNAFIDKSARRNAVMHGYTSINRYVIDTTYNSCRTRMVRMLVRYDKPFNPTAIE